MDFEFTEEQKALMKAVDDFLAKEWTEDLARRVDETGEWPWDFYRKAAKLGFVCPHFPEECGGQGLSPLDFGLIVYTFARRGSLFLIPTGGFGSELLTFSPSEIREEFARKVPAGEAVAFGAFTEPSGGSDLGVTRLLDVKARLEGDTWVISGTKTFISCAPFATFGSVLVQTDLNAKPPYRGQTWLFIPRMDLPGLEVRRLPSTSGLLEYSEMSFDDVRVPKEYVLGELNKGFYLGMHYLNEMRAIVGLVAIGFAERALEITLKWIKERKVFGRPLATYDSIRHEIADALAPLEGAKLLALKVLDMCSKGGEAKYGSSEIRRLSSMAKLYGTEVAMLAVERLVRYWGGYAWSRDQEINRIWRLMLSLVIVEGVSALHRDGIAREAIGRISRE
jgi:alkylation response protein AidB-like acyl-CoA dehydrogenase